YGKLILSAMFSAREGATTFCLRLQGGCWLRLFYLRHTTARGSSPAVLAHLTMPDRDRFRRPEKPWVPYAQVAHIGPTTSLAIIDCRMLSVYMAYLLGGMVRKRWRANHHSASRSL